MWHLAFPYCPAYNESLFPIAQDITIVVLGQHTAYQKCSGRSCVYECLPNWEDDVWTECTGDELKVKTADTAEGVLYDLTCVGFESKQNHLQVQGREQWKLGASWQRRGTKGTCLIIETCCLYWGLSEASIYICQNSWDCSL